MQQIAENHARSFRSTGEMINSVTAGDPVVATCPCLLKVEAKTNWKLLLVGVLVAAALQIAQAVAGEAMVLIGLIIGAVAIFYAVRTFLKGFRNTADALAISNQNVYLFKDVVFNKKSNTFSFGNAFKAGRGQLKKKFIFQLFGSAIRFKAGDFTCLATKAPRKKAAHYNYGNVVSVKEAKRMLFP